MHYYSHHIGDFNSATRHLSRLERAIYRDLLDIYYESERPLTTDFDRLARLALVGDDERSTLRDILNEFFKLDEVGYRNKRADAEIAAYQAMREGGKRGAANRWSKGGDRGGIAAPSPPQCQPVTSNHEPITKKREGLPAAFQKVIQTRPELNAEHVFAKFAEFYAEDQRTLAAWKAWVSREIPDAKALMAVTVPSRRGPDPALVKIEMDAKNSAPMPDAVRKALEKIRGQRGIHPP